MKGFYPVLNEIHDKAARELPLAELGLFEHIWRKLIGWNQFEDEISISQLVKETASSRATIIRLRNSLEAKRWIVVTRQSSVTERKFTSKIAIPACPGIIMRLGWYQIDTKGGIEMIPGGGIKIRHTTDSSSTDRSKNNNDHDNSGYRVNAQIKSIEDGVMRIPDEGEFTDRAVPTNEIAAQQKPLPSLSKQPGHNNGELPNGMKVQDFYALIEFKVGIVKRGVDEHQGMVDYLSTVPEDRLKTVVKHAIVDNTPPRFGLQYIYEHCDQWDYWSKRWNVQKKPKQRTDKQIAVRDMQRLVSDYRTYDPETGIDRNANTLLFLTNSMSRHAKWYDTVDNFGDIVGMQLSEYEEMMK